ncbi:unnamed protein product [Euphydryas editha]|uniref:Uncharacterized protein n=1 Tax=Euphydryas editha TaxID=104508 RepID=A0AAU9VDC5_EUPED|nr:unnamed protein product [Euphydryas editha]
MVILWVLEVRLSADAVKLTADLDLADPKFDLPGTVDLLLGADVLGKILLDKDRVLQPGGLVALQTIFGFALMGPVLRAPPPAELWTALIMGSALSDAVQRFWEMEEPPQALRSDPEHEECERFYKTNTSYLSSGRIMTRLPFLAVRPPLGISRPTAEKRLLAMERRMSRDPLLKEKYIDFMREYEDLGHMSVSKFDWHSMDHFFLPHDAVIKPSSGKLRSVFDGSAQTTSEVSSNQCLHSGPKLLKDLCDVITRFRRHQFFFVADIKMMFRQTVIHPDDRRYQLIL